jgi:hypothetical protein
VTTIISSISVTPVSALSSIVMKIFLMSSSGEEA